MTMIIIIAAVIKIIIVNSHVYCQDRNLIMILAIILIRIILMILVMFIAMIMIMIIMMIIFKHGADYCNHAVVVTMSEEETTQDHYDDETDYEY